MATAYVEYPPGQNRVVTLPEHALRPPGVAYLAGETLQAPIDIARNLPAENALRNDIEQLCNATLTIDRAFYDIEQKLSQATKEQKKRAELYKICYDLEARWKQHHKTYKQLLWRSREVAGEARFVVDDFREVFLPCLRDPATTLPQRQHLAQEHIEKLEDKARTSENLSQKFLDFVEVLDGYMADFSRAVKRLGYREQTEKCRMLENKLDSAKAAMDGVSKEVKALGWRFARDVFVTGVLGLLTVLAPVWWAALFGAAATGVSLYSNIQDLQPVSRVKRALAVRNCNAIENELDSEQACLRQMVNLQSALEDAAPIVQGVTTKLGAFASVWAAIAADIRQIVHHSQNCGETETSHMLFAQRVEMLEALYGCLSEALRYYQVTVRMPEGSAGLDEENSIGFYSIRRMFGFTPARA